MKLRPYQKEAVNGIYDAFKRAASTLIVICTGGGKTITFATVAQEYMKRGRVMILAHRAELIYQAQDKLLAVTGVEADIEMGDRHVQQFSAWQSKAVCSTIQTQISGMGGAGRMTKFDPDDFSLLVVDECHHSAARSYREVIDYYRQNPALKVLGVTATPDRADEKALGQIFETVAYEYGILEGIRDGYLVPITQQAVYVDGLDYSSVRTTAGDLNGADLAKVLEFEEALHGIASPTLELVRDRRALVFAASLAQAERLTEIFNRHAAGSAQWVHGGTPAEERAQLFADYAAKRFQILVNVGIATEGFDDAGIEVVVMARPTKSRSLFSQMAGRGTRVLPGIIDHLETPEQRRAAIAASPKPCLEIIDFVGNSGRHKLISAADILGGTYDDEIVERARKNMQEKADSGVPADVATELEKAEAEIERELAAKDEQARRRKLVVLAKFSTAKVNPFDVLDVMPRREAAWHKDRQPSRKQLDMLERNGVDTAGLSFTHASQLIQQIIDRRENKKASYKQVKILARNRSGLSRDPADYSFTEANRLIDALASNRWQIPANWESTINQTAEVA